MPNKAHFKPNEIDVPDENPFKNDKLSRKESVNNLATLLKNAASPLTISINGGWGTGKTTFLKMIDTTLQKEGGQTIFFNAWKNDFSKEPLVTFLAEINEKIPSDTAIPKWDKAKAAILPMIKRGIIESAKVASAGALQLDSLDDMNNLLSEYSEEKKLLEEFHANMKEIFSGGDSEHTLYIFVDELDRCRPTYAIELLERIKHIFPVEGLVFVLAMDKEQLMHSIKNVYGSDFDAAGYLRRFIDVEYALPQSVLEAFIDGLWKQYDFYSFFEERALHNYSETRHDSENLLAAFQHVCAVKNLSLREVEQILAHINLVRWATANDQYLQAELIVFFVIAKGLYPKEYYACIKNSEDYESWISVLYKIFPEAVRHDFENNHYVVRTCAITEGYLIMPSVHPSEDFSKIVEKHISSRSATPKDKDYLAEVTRILQYAHENHKDEMYFKLEYSIKRVEMLSQFHFGDDADR